MLVENAAEIHRYAYVSWRRSAGSPDLHVTSGTLVSPFPALAQVIQVSIQSDLSSDLPRQYLI